MQAGRLRYRSVEQETGKARERERELVSGGRERVRESLGADRYGAARRAGSPINQ